MLRNSVYMDGLTAQAADMIESGRAAVPPNDVAMGYVTRADCAAAAAAVLTTPGHANRVYDITGPELVGTREIAAAAAAVGGRKIEIVEGGAGRGGMGMAALGFVSDDFERLTGRKPMSLRALLTAD
jgi:NAD(P)H dehydrogenase (quinone)